MNNQPWQKVAVMGAGAVGCYFGGMLARAGVKVSLITRQRNVDAIIRDGLLLQSIHFHERIRISATIDPAAVSDAQLVLFCVKALDTEEAAQAIAPHLEQEAVVLSLQNGVDNSERIRLHVQNEVIPAVVYVAVEITAPGCVRHNGRGDLIIGPLDRRVKDQVLAGIAAFFSDALIPVRISDNIEGELWTKLAMNCAYNAISALGRSRYGRMIASPSTRGVMRQAVEEIMDVAHAKRIRFPDENLIESVFKLADTMPEAISSTAQDIARGRRTEIDHLNGYVVRQGEALGLSTPVNRTLHALVKLLEEAKPDQPV